MVLPSCLPLLLFGLLCNCSLLIRFLFRIKGLEKKLHSVQLAKKKAKETFRRKCVFLPGWCHWKRVWMTLTGDEPCGRRAGSLSWDATVAGSMLYFLREG